MRLMASLHGTGDYMATVNIRADRMEKDEEFCFVYDRDRLVGVFDLGCVLAIYLSGEKKEDQQNVKV